MAEIWRYPVKSMAGEPLEEATLGPLGIEGDRILHVERPNGRFVTARTHPQLLGHKARLGFSGEPLVDGRPWTDDDVQTDIVRIGGAGSRLVHDESADRFDILPLLVATDGAIAAFGAGGRRLRPNIVIGGVNGLEERTWAGRCLRIGDVLIQLVDLRARCVMTTYDPDTLQQDTGVLKDIVRRFDGTLALNAEVAAGGRLRRGDPVELLPLGACPSSTSRRP